MDCKEVKEKLSLYLDRELDEATQEMIETHLESCSECREALSSLQSVIMLTSGLAEVEPPVGLSSAIREAALREGEAAGSCAYYKSLLSEYVDDELSSEDVAEVESHLAFCRHCGDELTAIRAAIAAASMLEEVAPPASLRSRIAAATTGRKTKVSVQVMQRLSRLLTLPRLGWAVGASTASVILLAVIIGQSQKPDLKPADKVTTAAPPSLVVETPEVIRPMIEEVQTVPAKRTAVTVLRQAVKTRVVSYQPAIKAEKTSVPIARKSETAKPANKTEVVHSASTPSAEVAFASPSKVEDTADSKNPEVNARLENVGETIAEANPAPKATFIKLGRRNTWNPEDTSAYIEDIKAVAEMRRKASNRISVDVISRKF